MIAGKIKRVFIDKGYGFITYEKGKKVFFHINGMVNRNIFNLLSENDEVFFEGIKKTAKGEEAFNIFCEKKDFGSQIAQKKTKHRFRNPYNFVRFDPTLNYSYSYRQNPLRCNDDQILYDGYINVTMQINSPLFCSGKESNPTHTGHKLYDFYKIDGTPRIPASSLRGMIRNVFETITNSCMCMFEGQHLTRRMSATEAQKMIPAIVEEDHNHKTLHARLLRGHVKKNEQNHSLQFAAWYKMYHRHDTVGSTNGIQHGDKCWAVIENKPVLKEKGRNKFYYWKVRDIHPKTMDQSSISYNLNECFLVNGYFFKSNNNINRKHDERIFFDLGETPKSLPLESGILDEYETVLNDYIRRHSDDIEKRSESSYPCKPDQADEKHKAISHFIISKKTKLQNGDLIYVAVDNVKDPTSIKFVAPVSIARLLFDNSIEDILDSSYPDLRSCDFFNTSNNFENLKLCPACRTFGWVRTKNSASNAISSCGSKIFFDDGKITDAEFLDEITLPILGQPKPTTQPFYLLTKDGKESFSVDYNIYKSQLRGRKYYWHQEKLNKSEYSIRKRGIQNRTIKNIIQKGKIKFRVRFNDLSDFELGALLYAIKLEKGWQHSLGLAKPLGFGSLEATELKLYLKNDEYYHSFTKSLKSEKDEFVTQKINTFNEKYKTIFGKLFSETITFLDLKQLLGNPQSVAVHYPRTTDTLDENGKQFKWFMDNKNIWKKALPIAGDKTDFDFEI